MAQGKKDDLEQFAKRIATRVKESGGNTDSMERLVCRLMVGKKSSPQVAATMAAKWVEWRYGRAKETVKVEGTVIHEHVDLSKLSEEEFAPIRKLIESAHERADS